MVVVVEGEAVVAVVVEEEVEAEIELPCKSGSFTLPAPLKESLRPGPPLMNDRVGRRPLLESMEGRGDSWTNSNLG